MRRFLTAVTVAAAGVMSAVAESPYGAEVIECVTGEGDLRFNNPANVLGEPARFVNIYSGSWGGVGYSDVYGGVVHPVVPAYTGGRFLSLDSTEDDETGDEVNGYVVIAFDHDVVDDPDNPFGVDFIVFGNSMCLKSTTTGMTALDDPASCVLTASGTWEDAVVEVAQNTNGPWYTSPRWRTSDGFAPTLGHVYDPANADTNLYSGNLWWGAKTDATYPVDPRVSYFDCVGLTLAELCRRYNGSAGGTGYDLADADGLPADAAHGGRKWFRYVRISNVETEERNEHGDYCSLPEVDAVADVAPVSGYRQWVLANFSWAEAWQTNLTAATVVAPNGLPNAMNCLYGLKPTDVVTNDVPFEVKSFIPGATEHAIAMRSPARLTSAPKGLVVKESATIDGGWTSVAPTLRASELQDDGTWLNTFTVPRGEGAFFRLSLDTE